MRNLKAINQSIEFIDSFEMVSQSYQEIAVLEMKKIRSSVLNSRFYFEQLENLFKEIQVSYQREITKLLMLHQVKTLQQYAKLSKNGRKIVILVTPNSRMYGNLTEIIFKEFLKHIEGPKTDIAIVGKVGKLMYDAIEYKKPYTFFEIPDNSLKIEDIRPLIYFTFPYHEIHMVHGRFENIIHQAPVLTDITAISHDHDHIDSTVAEFLLEPSIEGILHFFHMQIFSSFFKQVVYESYLARAASRITSMTDVLGNLTVMRAKSTLQRNFYKKNNDNKRQLEKLIAMRGRFG